MPLQLAELALYIPSCIPLFEKYELDYYVHGHRTLRQACADKELSFDQVDAELKNLPRDTSLSYLLTLEEMDLARLIDFINGQHHASEEEVLSIIKNHIQYLRNEEESTSDHRKKWDELLTNFEQFEKRLLTHCVKEDKILFPHLRKLFEARSDKHLPDLSECTVAAHDLIENLEEEHLQAVAMLNGIKRRLQSFKTPLVFSKRFKELMDTLQAFEYDFHIHLHIENNVLFPKFHELEEKINWRF